MTPKNELEEKWKDLHTEVVNRIIRFLKENGVNNVTDVYLSIDTVDFSVQHGEWTPMTDSSFEAIDNIEDKEFCGVYNKETIMKKVRNSNSNYLS